MRLATRVTALFIAIGVLGGCAVPSPSANPTAPETQGNTAVPGEPTNAGPTEWAAATYPVFDPVTIAGEGNDLVPLPADALAGVIHAKHDDLVYIGITILDADMTSTGDLLVNHPGAYEGTTVYGLRSYAGPPAYIEMRASGSWEITIAPMASLPVGVTSGEGDMVFLYDGPAATMRFTHDGEANFIVTEHSPEIFNWLRVNGMGAADTTADFAAGPTMIAVKADGSWTMGPA